MITTFQYNPATQRFTSRYPDNNEQNYISEGLGVGGALATIGEVYNLHYADWTRIPRRNPGLDFYYDAAELNMRIVVEAKGNISSDNNVKSNAIYQQKRAILRQKGVIDDNEDNNNSLLIGVITAADRKNYLKAWLVDPPIEDFKGNLRKLKLLKRLYFYYNYLYLISPRSAITIALANRIISIEQVNDYEKLNDIPLLNARFTDFEIGNSFFQNKTSNVEQTVFGKIQPVNLDDLIFIGLTTKVLQALLMQNFEELLNYKTQPYTNQEEIFQCTLSLSSDISRRFFKENDFERENEVKKNKFKFIANAEHFLSSSGLNYCKINKKQIERNLFDLYNL